MSRAPIGDNSPEYTENRKNRFPLTLKAYCVIVILLAGWNLSDGSLTLYKVLTSAPSAAGVESTVASIMVLVTGLSLILYGALLAGALLMLRQNGIGWSISTGTHLSIAVLSVFMLSPVSAVIHAGLYFFLRPKQEVFDPL